MTAVSKEGMMGGPEVWVLHGGSEKLYSVLQFITFLCDFGQVTAT